LSRGGSSPCPTVTGTGAWSGITHSRGAPAPIPSYIPRHNRASEEATVLRDTAASDDPVVVLFLSLVGFDLSLWLLSRGFLELLL
jgi:hypothetical protein